MTRALVLFAHGSREPAWAGSLHSLAGALHAVLPDAVVRTAFLERQPPSLPRVLEELARAGIAEVSVLPVFWAAHGHVLRELPRFAAGAPPGMRVRILPALSELPGMTDFVARGARALFADGP